MLSTDDIGARLDELLVAGGPFIDLRSPGEYALGAVPGAVNLPLLHDDERHQVGLTYSQAGQAAAIELGERLVSGPVRRERLEGWLQFARTHPGTWLYCWRGGLRSETVQHWLAAEGLTLPRVAGGFKALRRHCLSVLESAPEAKPWYVLGGRTGTGKTVVLKRISGAIDLEGLANHRGSAFGAAATPPPPPVGFETALAVACLRHQAAALVLEDESRTIGRLALPNAWHAAMQQAPLIILEAPLEMRVAHIAEEYVSQPLAAGVAPGTLEDRLQSSLDRIGRRLGGLRRQRVAQALSTGFQRGDHEPWIRYLLQWYYDPMYDYQLARKADRVIFRGNAAAVEEFLAERLAAARS